jgi:hypothetical protein
MENIAWDTAWVLLRGSWPFAPLTDDFVEAVWRDALGDLDPKDLVMAVKKEVRDGSDRLPSIAALKKTANQCAKDRRLATESEHLKVEAPFNPIPDEWAISGQEALRRIRSAPDPEMPL